MRTALSIFFVVLLSFGVFQIAKAQTEESETGSVVSPTSPTVTEVIPKRTNVLQRYKTEVKEVKENVQIEVQGIQEKRGVIKEAVIQKKDAMQEIRKNAVSEVKERALDKKTDVQNVLKDKRAEKETQIGEKEAKRVAKQEELQARKKEMEAKAKERAAAYFEKMLKRLYAAVDRLQTLAQRVLSRAEKLAERGVDVSKTRELLAIAQTKIFDAKTKLEQVGVQVREVLSEEIDKRALFERVKELTQSSVEDIKAAHRALVDAIASLKASAGQREGVPKIEDESVPTE